jgi:hypothetical protein
MKWLVLPLLFLSLVGAVAAEPLKLILVTVETTWNDGAVVSAVGDVEQVLYEGAAGYTVASGDGTKYVVPRGNARTVSSEEAAIALLAQRDRLYAQLSNALAAAASAKNPAPTQYSGRPLPRTWIDPKQADQNWNAERLLRQQRELQGELQRLNNELQRQRR